MLNLINVLAHSMYEQTPKSRFVVALVATLLIFLCAYVVYLTGGTHLSYLHLIYIPIVIVGLWFGVFYGIFMGIVAGFAIGPLMPENVQENLFQGTETWGFRTFFFCLVGLLSGLVSHLSKSYYHILEARFLTDPATELLNYKGISKLFPSLQRLSGVIMIRFKQLRDVEKAFGPAAHASAILSICERLKQLLGADATLARLSEDTFLITLTGQESPFQVAQRISYNLDKSYKFQDIPFQIEATFSVAPRDNFGAAVQFEDILRSGLIAVDHAVEENHTLTTFNETSRDESERNIFILHELSRAIEEDQLSLNYQPIVTADTKEVIGVEALARWSHSTLGMISPLEFTGIAEKTQLINPYTKWLLKKSLQQLSNWHKRGIHVTLSVNFSMKNFQDPSVIKNVFELLEQYQLPPELLQVEVTETAIAENIEKTSDILHMLREKRIKIAIDDFGTGQSSLKYLLDLPVDVLKIDRTFITNMMTNSASEAIVRSAITLGHELNLKVIAEGIEEEDQLLHLQKIGCDYVQGYLISRPMPLELATNWLESKRGNITKISLVQP